jgi:hypothetical protein
LLLSAPLILVALILGATSLIRTASLLFRLALLIKASAIFLGFVSAQLFRVGTLCFSLLSPLFSLTFLIKTASVFLPFVSPL